MSTQHTLERLSATEKVGDVFAIRDAGGMPIAGAYQSSHARRLVACWNACEGLDTEGLENLASMHDRAITGHLRAITEASRTRVQCDELLGTIRTVTSIAHCGGLANLSESDALAKIRRATLKHFDPNASNSDHLAVIAKAEGGAA